MKCRTPPFTTTESLRTTNHSKGEDKMKSRLSVGVTAAAILRTSGFWGVRGTGPGTGACSGGRAEAPGAQRPDEPVAGVDEAAVAALAPAKTKSRHSPAYPSGPGPAK